MQLLHRKNLIYFHTAHSRPQSPEFNSTVCSIILPHVQLHYNLRKFENSSKSSQVCQDTHLCATYNPKLPRNSSPSVIPAQNQPHCYLFIDSSVKRRHIQLHIYYAQTLCMRHIHWNSKMID